ncbi:hypothetical protein [Dokdonella soli]|uniref:Uncharacterized protein n=1 Tax=Dokdonella soli TaxID=529810 RepID=A0ABP3TZF8_9GAMM
MPGLFIGWARVRTSGQFDADAVSHAGRKLLGQLNETRARWGSFQGVLRKTLPDGTRVSVRMVGTIPIIEVEGIVTASTAQQSQPSQIWIPRGFVVYPASTASPLGWGLPIIQRTQTGDTAYSAVNTAPGLDVSRWTPGGALGQVLLTRVPGAGYPPVGTPIAPLMYHPTFGPKPVRSTQRIDIVLDQATGPWSAYRLELTNYADSAHAASIGARRAVFELTNTHRVGIGRDPLNLPLRGFYSMSQTYTDMMAATSVLGHFADPFYPTYKAGPDRICKDGFPTPQTRYLTVYGGGSVDADNRDVCGSAGENMEAFAVSFTVIGTDPNGDNISLVNGPAQSVDPQAAFNGWLGSPPHRFDIESPLWDHGSAFLDVGTTGGFIAQDFTLRDQWIQTGNAYWYSTHPEVPALSWLSFHSMNLAYEMWPVDALSGVLTDVAQLTNSDAFWLAYGYNKLDRVNTKVIGASLRPALSSSLYMRGRIIAIVPHGGFVLGAAIQKLPAPLLATQPQMYRLIALVHVQTDQVGTQTTNGATPILHVYTIDLPDFEGFAAHSDSVIKGVRGHPISTFPWQVADDPWAWIDAGTIDVSSSSGTGTNLLTYLSLWRFNADGSQAVCLRSEATMADFISHITTTAGTEEYFGVVRPLLLNTPITGSPLAASLALLPASPPDTISGTTRQKVFRPMAADYGPAGDIQFIYVGYDSSNNPALNPYYEKLYYGKGPPGLTSIPQLSNPVVLPRPSAPATDVVAGICTLVASVVDFVLIEAHIPVPTLSTCWQFTNANVLYVSTYRQGALIDARWFSNPDGTYFETDYMCNTWFDCNHNFLFFSGLYLIHSIARFIQASYATNRAGDWVLSYQVSPQPYEGQTFMHTAAAPYVQADCAGYSACTPSWPDLLSHPAQYGCPAYWNSHNTTLDDLNPRGGWCTSSFADNAHLAALTQTPGSGLFFNRVGVV